MTLPYSISGYICLCALFITAGSEKSASPLTHRRQLGRRLSQAQCPDAALPPLTPTVFHAPPVDFTWVGKDDQHVFAVTRRLTSDAGGLWRSGDGGSTWTDLTPRLNSSKARAQPFSVLSIFSQGSKPGNIVIMGTGAWMWQSFDFGETFSVLPLPGSWRGSSVRSLRVHPAHDDWLLLLARRPDCRSSDRAQTECPMDLWLTQSLFATDQKWRNLTAEAKGKAAGFVDFDWASNLCTRGACEPGVQLPPEAIFATLYEKPGDYDQSWDPDVHFVVSHTFFKTFETHVRCGNMFELVGGSVYMAFANSCPTDIHGNPLKGPSPYPHGITLFTSRDGGNSFVQACLPVALKQEGYELMETSDGRGAIVVVDYVISSGDMDLEGSSVYVAGPHHALFSMSLTDVATGPYGSSTDFTRVEGIPGVYIANQMLPRPTDPGAAPQPKPSSGDSAADYFSDYSSIADSVSTPLVETRITFNGGGHWQRIPAPSKIVNPVCDRCGGSPQCFLHLHGMSSWSGPGANLPAVYSNAAAPGLVMGTGNVAPVGQGLDDNDGLCTWISYDGGVSWAEVGPGAYIYEFADWGGVVVAAQHPGSSGSPAEEVLVSADYGRCWQRVPLGVALLVDNIRIEPDGQRPRVLLHGRACRQPASPKCSHTAEDTASATEGVVYVVDVASVFAGRMGACASSDYERWTVPTLTNSPRCVLGQQMQYVRRRQDSLCLNGGDYQRPAPSNTTCACSTEDVECDYGFQRSKDGGRCVPIPKDRMPQCPVVDARTYTVSASGLRMLHGDVCSGIDAVIHDTDGKGHTAGGDPGGPSGGGGKGGSGWWSFTIFAMVVGSLGGLFYAWWRCMARPEHKELLVDIASSAASFLASLWELLMDKAAQLVGKLAARLRGGQGGAPGGVQAPADELGYFQPLGDPGVQGGRPVGQADGRPRPGGFFTLGGGDRSSLLTSTQPHDGHDVDGSGGIFTLK